MKLRLILLIALSIMICSAYAETDGGSSKPDGKTSADVKYGQAIDLLKKDMEPNMGNANLLFQNCNCIKEKKDLVKAKECYDKVITICNKVLNKDQSQTDALDLQDDTNDALSELNGDLWKNPPGSNCTCIKNSSYDAIIAGYDRALELNSSNAAAWNNRGVLLGDLCCLNESLSSFDNAIGINSSLPEPWYNKGISLFYHRPKMALECFNRSIELDPNLAEAWFNRYALLVPSQIDMNDPASRKAYEMALSDYQMAVKLNPDLEMYEPPFLEYRKMR